MQLPGLQPGQAVTPGGQHQGNTHQQLPPLPPSAHQHTPQQPLLQQQQHAQATTAPQHAVSSSGTPLAPVGSTLLAGQQQLPAAASSAQTPAASASAGAAPPAAAAAAAAAGGHNVPMTHVVADNGCLNLGGGVLFQIPLWYDDLAKTGVVPRYVQSQQQQQQQQQQRSSGHLIFTTPCAQPFWLTCTHNLADLYPRGGVGWGVGGGACPAPCCSH